MDKFCLINIEWNHWNGFMFSILQIECDWIEGDLLGIHIGGWNSYFHIYLLYFRIEIYHTFPSHWFRKDKQNKP